MRTSWEVGGGGLKFLYPSAASHFAQPWLVKASTSPSATPPGPAFCEGTLLHCTTGECRRGGVCRGGQRAAQWRLPAGRNRSARFPSHFRWGGVRRLTKRSNLRADVEDAVIRLPAAHIGISVFSALIQLWNPPPQSLPVASKAES